jgi:hypothetical protein
LLLAALATGCIISSDDTADEATIRADWSFHTVNNMGALSPANSCPTGYNTVALHSQELDATGRATSTPEIIDLFDCVAMSDLSDPLPPSVYSSQLWITSDGGGSVYAKTIPAIVDVTVDDKTFDAKIVDNGGFFKVSWDLRKQATNAPLVCRDVAGLDGIEISSTLTTAGAAVVDTFDCDVGFDYSDPVIQGNYVVKMDALDTTGKPIGSGKLINNVTMGDRNQITDLGTVQLLIP